MQRNIWQRHSPHDKFVEKTEKELGNAKLLSIEQINNDRIVSFNFDKGALVFEMFGHGNIILVKDRKTITAMRFESWSDREIKPGSTYRYPSSKPSEKLEASEKYIIVSLMKLPLGKEYALEALARLGIDEKTPGKKLSGNQLGMLEKELLSIRESAKPFLFLAGGKPAEYSLARLSAYSDLDAKECKTLSEAADEYYANMEEANPELDKLQRRLEKQEERLERLKEEEKSYKEKGDYIYANYQQVEEILEKAKEGKIKTDKKEKSVEADI